MSSPPRSPRTPDRPPVPDPPRPPDPTPPDPTPDPVVTAAAVRAVLSDLGEVPLPGGGATRRRFAALADAGSGDLGVARLVEGHLDAVAICAEAGVAPPAGLAGVWAADPPTGRVDAAGDAVTGWCLTGTKRWCSGGSLLDEALVTVHAVDGYRLVRLPLDTQGVAPVPGTWSAVGMARSDTIDVVLDDVRVEAAQAVGGPGWYLDRRGFWAGGAGVAACWYGGARGALHALATAVARRGEDPHGLAHLGAADMLCAAMWAHLERVADAIDEGAEGAQLRRLAFEVRAAVDRLATDVLDHVGRGGGPALLTGDAAMARRAADLPVYLRQHHAERALAELGRDVAAAS